MSVNWPDIKVLETSLSRLQVILAQEANILGWYLIHITIKQMVAHGPSSLISFLVSTLSSWIFFLLCLKQEHISSSQSLDIQLHHISFWTFLAPVPFRKQVLWLTTSISFWRIDNWSICLRSIGICQSFM